MKLVRHKVKHMTVLRWGVCGYRYDTLLTQFGVLREITNDYSDQLQLTHRKWQQLNGCFLLPPMPHDRSGECVQGLTICHSAIHGFPTWQACGNYQVTCDMYRTKPSIILMRLDATVRMCNHMRLCYSFEMRFPASAHTRTYICTYILCVLCSWCPPTIHSG